MSILKLLYSVRLEGFKQNIFVFIFSFSSFTAYSIQGYPGEPSALETAGKISLGTKITGMMSKQAIGQIKNTKF